MKKVNNFFSLLLIFGGWKLLTLFFSPLVVPTISSVLQELFKITVTAGLYKMAAITTGRLVLGLAAGVAIGLILGILMGYFSHFKDVIVPIIGIMQTMPPVSWVVLALVWFGFNGKPAIFIVITSAIPIIAINIYEGITRIDGHLLQMAQLYRFSGQKRLRHVILPSIAPYFKSAFRVALGSGWKTAIMGEVLTTSDGIGGMIKLARLNVESESIIAWSVIAVLLFYASDFLISRVIFRRERNHADS
ncbi:MAG: ABC transporter permease [Clostridia bacterium BRH_c25]|nr:MAG: ABC transporter permease [Clostridia bacterium BRH_c25]